MKANLERTNAALSIVSVSLLLVICPDARSRAEIPAFPLSAQVEAIKTSLKSLSCTPTGLNKADYLSVVSGIVKHFRNFQGADGRIVDPYLHREIQYSTPCFAWAASALVLGGQTNWLGPAALALDASLEELATARCADNHGDFFTFPAMLAYEHLRDRVDNDRRAQWEQWLRDLNPAKTYRDVLSKSHPVVHNWNVVAIAGEFLRYQNGFTGPDFIEKHLPFQLGYFTAEGLYRDPNVPMAYDLFPRHYLAMMLWRGYQGSESAALGELLDRGAWTSLLMQSPLGEWPTGGRSAQHQWNEAMQCVAFEVWASRLQRSGTDAAAGAFKRAARLALGSVKRWIRPSGELWIVKNHFDPAVRHGFESVLLSYPIQSPNSQYACHRLVGSERWHFGKANTFRKRRLRVPDSRLSQGFRQCRWLLPRDRYSCRPALQQHGTGTNTQARRRSAAWPQRQFAGTT